jgi:hypothetical protein
MYAEIYWTTRKVGRGRREQGRRQWLVSRSWCATAIANAGIEARCDDIDEVALHHNFNLNAGVTRPVDGQQRRRDVGSDGTGYVQL